MGTILVLAVLLLCQSLNKIKTGGEIIDDEEFGDEATGFGGYEAANLFIWIALCIPLVFLLPTRCGCSFYLTPHFSYKAQAKIE